MESMKAKELKQKPKQEMMMMLKENREKLRRFRFDLANKKIKNTNEIRLIKKDIARILTLLRI